MEIKDISGVYNIGKRRFIVAGEKIAENDYKWDVDEVDENNKAFQGALRFFFLTEGIPYMSEVFDHIMEAVVGR